LKTSVRALKRLRQSFIYKSSVWNFCNLWTWTSRNWTSTIKASAMS